MLRGLGRALQDVGTAKTETIRNDDISFLAMDTASPAVPECGGKKKITNLCSDFPLQDECDYTHTIIWACIAADVSNRDWLKPLSFHPGISSSALPEAFRQGILVPGHF